MLITDAHTYRHTHIHTDQTLKMWFLDSGLLITSKSIKISISKIWPKNNTFSTYRLEKVKKKKYISIITMIFKYEILITTKIFSSIGILQKKNIEKQLYSEWNTSDISKE